MIEILRGGDWGDVFAARAGGIGLVYCQGNNIIVEIVDRRGNTREKFTTEMFPEPILFPRGAMNSSGQVFVCGKGHVSGKFYAYHFGKGFKTVPGLMAYGTHSCDVIPHDDVNFRFVSQHDQRVYYDSIDGATHNIPEAIFGTSQGIIQLLPSGPQWSDLLRESVAGMLYPFETPNLFIGEGREDPAHIEALDNNEHKAIYKGFADRPRCAVVDDLVAVATRDSRGTFFLIYERPLPNLELIPPAPIDPPVIPPTEKTMNEPALSLWHQWTQKFPNPGNTDESARAYSIKFAEQCRFSMGPNWGTKSADPNRPVSKDTVTERNGNKLTSYDLMLGVGTGNPQFNANPPAIDTTGQNFIEVAPHDYLGTIVTPPPIDPPVDPPPTTDKVVRMEITNYRELAKAFAEEFAKFS